MSKYTFSEEATLPISFCLTSQWGLLLRKEFAHREQILSSKRQSHFGRVLSSWKANMISQKFSSLKKLNRKLGGVPMRHRRSGSALFDYRHFCTCIMPLLYTLQSPYFTVSLLSHLQSRSETSMYCFSGGGIGVVNFWRVF